MSHAVTSCLLIAIALVIGACGDAGDTANDTESEAAQEGAPAPSSTSPPASAPSTTSTTESSAITDQSTAPSTVAPPATTSQEPGTTNTTQPPGAPAEDAPSGDVDPGEPTTIAPDTAVPPGFESLVAAARTDLAGRLGVDASQIGIAGAESIVWPDAGLGCPQPGMAYAQVQVDGFRLVLTHGGASYAYHGGGDRPQPFLCDKPSFP